MILLRRETDRHVNVLRKVKSTITKTKDVKRSENRVIIENN